jgi:HlyD family secretion protein
MNPYDEHQIELRSDEVQEILGTPPGWLIRWGTTAALFTFAVLLAAGWMVRYPDLIKAKIVLTTGNPPVALVARTDGNIVRLMVQDNEMVAKGAELLVLESTARYEDIVQLDQNVTRWQNLNADSLAQTLPPAGLELGDVQDAYSAFVQNLESYRFSKGDRRSSVGSNISAINQQIERLRQSIRFDERSKKRAEQQISSARDLFARQEELFRQGLISRVVLEQERQKVADAENAADQIEAGIFRKQNEIISLRNSINDASFSTRADDASLSVRLRESLSALRGSLDRWKQNYLLVAPVDGRVSMNAAYFSVQQFVKQGEQVLSIVPPVQSGTIIGRLSLPVAGSGKVKNGQRVVVKLDGYPFHEFGSLAGTVKSKSLIAQDETYNILVDLPAELKTNYGKYIPFEQQMQGQAEIVTEDKRFLQRILENVWSFGQ